MIQATFDTTDSEAPATPAESSDTRRRANQLDGKTWTRYSISVWSDIRKTPEEAALGHPAMFPSELPRRLIEIFTKDENSVIFDPFLGTGSTLVAAKSAGRKGIGVELSPEYVAIAEKRLNQKGLFESDPSSLIIHKADANNLRSIISPNSVDLVVTSPPYWDVLLQKRSADYKAQRDYGEEHEDLGKIRDYGRFLSALRNVFVQIFEILRPGAYCCVVVMDLRKKNKFFPFHSDLAAHMETAGFIFDDLIIWDRRHEYNNMRPLGYPSVFRVNKAHEYILIFQKPSIEE